MALAVGTKWVILQEHQPDCWRHVATASGALSHQDALERGAKKAGDLFPLVAFKPSWCLRKVEDG